jgi:hypothetical protein
LATTYFSKPNEPDGYVTICTNLRIANPFPYLDEYQKLINKTDVLLCLVHDKENRHDRNAVCICEYDMARNRIRKILGYLPSDLAGILTQEQVNLSTMRARLRAIWEGDYSNSLIVSFYIYSLIGSLPNDSRALRAFGHYDSFEHLGDFPFEQTISDYQSFFNEYAGKVSGGLEIICPKCRTKFNIRKYATLAKRKCPKCELDIKLRYIDRHMELHKNDILQYMNGGRSTGCLALIGGIVALAASMLLVACFLIGGVQ